MYVCMYQVRAALSELHILHIAVDLTSTRLTQNNNNAHRTKTKINGRNKTDKQTSHKHITANHRKQNKTKKKKTTTKTKRVPKQSTMRHTCKTKFQSQLTHHEDCDLLLTWTCDSANLPACLWLIHAGWRSIIQSRSAEDSLDHQHELHPG